MPFTEDLTEFLATGDFATAATYKLLGAGSGTTVNVIYDAPDHEALGINGTRPRAVGRASDFSAFTSTDTITINSIIYRIKDVQPLDDGSMVELMLEDQT